MAEHYTISGSFRACGWRVRTTGLGRISAGQPLDRWQTVRFQRRPRGLDDKLPALPVYMFERAR